MRDSTAPWESSHQSAQAAGLGLGLLDLGREGCRTWNPSLHSAGRTTPGASKHWSDCLPLLKRPTKHGLAFPYSAPSAVPVLGHLAASPLEGLLGPSGRAMWSCLSGLEEVKKLRLSMELSHVVTQSQAWSQRPIPQMLLVCCPSCSVSFPEYLHITSHLINT